MEEEAHAPKVAENVPDARGWNGKFQRRPCVMKTLGFSGKDELCPDGKMVHLIRWERMGVAGEAMGNDARFGGGEDFLILLCRRDRGFVLFSDPGNEIQLRGGFGPAGLECVFKTAFAPGIRGS
jgi:hypothetical protein